MSSPLDRIKNLREDAVRDKVLIDINKELLKNELNEALNDELNDKDKYKRMSEVANAIGYSGLSDLLLDISKDEQKHYEQLSRLVKEI